MSITLEQARTIVETGDQLLAQLQDIDHTIGAYKRVPGDLVRCKAYPGEPRGETPGGSGIGFGGRDLYGVEMLPIPKTQVLSALERQRTKITNQLAQLGVEVPPSPTGDPQ